MKGFLKSFLLVTVPTLIITILLLEFVLSFFMPLPSRPKTIYDQQTNILKFSPESGSGTYTKGKFFQLRADWNINNAGWNSAIDYQADTKNDRIAIIGDSYVEALQVDVDENFPHLMRERMGVEQNIYAFGKSLYPLSQYLHISRHVVEMYNPSTLIFTVVHNDFEESLNGGGTDLRHQALMQLIVKPDSSVIERAPYHHDYVQERLNPGWFRQLMLKSRLQRYIRYPDFLGIQPMRGIQRLLNQPASTINNNEPVYEANVDVEKVVGKKNQITLGVHYIVKKIREENPDKRIIFVMDSPRQLIYSGSSPKESGVYWLHELMAKATQNNNIEFIDLSSYMENDYKKNGRKFNSEIDSHWNEYGHQFVAKILVNYLTSDQ